MQNTDTYPEVTIYTDGGADPNPGPGGIGVVMTYKGHRKEFSQGYLHTSNNRMELRAVIFALEQLKKPSIVHVYSDSRYVVDGISLGWAQKWRSNNWYRTRTERALNHDLWGRLLDLIDQQHSVTFHWVKGHSGLPENERCDQLATLALKGDQRIEDTGYESFADTANNELHHQDGNPPAYKTKITKEGDLCRKCTTPVIKMKPKRQTLKPGQNYYFEYYFLCPNCNTMYMVEEAKRFGNSEENTLFG